LVLPAVLPEASVVRSLSPAPAAGGRSPAGAEQAVGPFSDLLDLCEGTEASTPDLVANPAEATRIEAAPAEPKAAPLEDAAKMSNAAEAATAQVELMLAMVTGLLAAPEGKKLPLPAGVAVSEPASDDAQPKTDAETTTLPAQTDAADVADALAVAQPIPLPPVAPVASPVALPTAMPMPSPIPAIIDAIAAPITEAVPAAAPAAGDPKAPVSISPAAPVPENAEPISPKNAASVSQATEKPPAAPPPVVRGETPAAGKAETHSNAEAAKRAVSTSSPKHATTAAKLAPAEVSAAAEKPTARTMEASAALEKPATRPAQAGAAVEKPATRPAEVPVIVTQRDVEAPDAKPATGNAPVSTETAANLGALATPSAHIAPASAETAATLGALSAPPAHAAPAGPQAAHPPAHQPAPTDTVPVAGLAVEIAAQARSGKNRFEIRLDPPELGRIDVRIEVDKDGQVTSHLRVERAETLDLLRRDAPALERALQQAGLKTSDGGLQFSLRDQAFSHRDQGRDMPAAARIVVSDDMLVPVETQRHYGRLAGLGGGVDIQV
jgi:flagellar hook-length control protein FliK